MNEQQYNQPTAWERKILENLAEQGLIEQRRRRRWGIFFRLVGLFYVGVFFYLLGDFGGTAKNTSTPHTALISIDGVIDADGGAGASRVLPSLQAAFEDSGTQGVILRINSPGGSPVQSGIIYDEIKRLRAKYPKIPLYAVVEDICASGGYYIASAADKIYVDKASLIGSIGVLMDGFGFEDVMKKVGVERRLLTAGENKGFMDPFSPVNEKQKAHARAMLTEIHQQFIKAVKDGRGDRLKNDPDLFSGLVWNGTRGIELGLADDTGTIESVARDVIKQEDILDYTEKETFAERFAKRVGVTFGEAFGKTAMSQWARGVYLR